MNRARRALALLVVAAAWPAAAWLLPVPSVLRRAAERRAALSLATIEVTGALQAGGDGAGAILDAGGVRAAGGLAEIAARIQWKAPGRCRVELAPPGLPEAERPFVAVRDGAVSGSRAFQGSGPLVALARATCALLATASDKAAPDRPLAAALAGRGVALTDVGLGRFDGRIAYVVGGRTGGSAPLAWFDKETFQPMRLQYVEAGAPADVRLLGWGSPTGGDWFPRALEVHQGGALRLRFTTERASANPRLSDLLFP